MKRTHTFALFALFAGLAQAQNSSVVQLPSEWLYLLPQPFNSSIEYSWLNSTTTENATINSALQAAKQSRFVSYSDEFTSLIGPNPSMRTIQCPPSAPDCAFEGGVWLPDTDEVWFNYYGFDYPFNQTITSFNLHNNSAHQLTTNPPIRYPFGGYLYNGLVYLTEFNATTSPASIITVDPKTLAVTPILNSYQGIPLAPCDDVVVTRINNKDFIFLTTFSIQNVIGPPFPRQRYSTAVWRFDLEEKVLLPVISANEIVAPNGIRVSPDGRTLYVTNTATTNFTSQASDSTKSNSIYEFDLNERGKPVNGRLFALVRTGIANGIHVDRKGRVWTAEDDGINVRSPGGRLLGTFNYLPFHEVGGEPRIGNFALAGDRLVIGVVGYVLIYDLAEMLVTPGNLLTN
jgi:gluconolactonase